MIALAVAPEKGMRADWFFVVGKPIGFSFWGIKKMNEIATEKTVTTKELAEMLGVDVDTVNNTVNRLGFSDVLRKSTGGRPTRVFNEKQATLIKQAIQRHHNLVTRQIDNVSTDLEGELLVQKAMAYQQMKINQLQAKVKEMQPKAIIYDEFVSRDRFCNFRDGANYLHISQSDLMNLLKTRYIYKNNVGEYRCYGEYSQYFTLRPFTLGDKTKQQLMFTIKGLEFFKNKINSTKRVEA
ncbi:MAG: phage antirepressor KilAC domain-containing protein [Clostridia bacterium]|nr:phage antirepressor KilAC domain-containing protein [Clostridia bacterium]